MRDALLLLYAAGGTTATGGIGGDLLVPPGRPAVSTGSAPGGTGTGSAAAGPQHGCDFGAPSEVTWPGELEPEMRPTRLCAQSSVAPERLLT